MARIIEEWPSITRTRASRYPWAEWTNGAIWEVREAEDFSSNLKTFVQGLYAYGKRHGMKVEVRTSPDDGVVAFRFISGAQVAAAPAEASVSQEDALVPSN